MTNGSAGVQIERRDRLPASAAAADFSFEITSEAVAPFCGPGLSRVVRVPRRRKRYGIDADLFEPAEAETRAVFVAREADTIAGYIAVSRLWNEMALIDDIAVARRFRREGLARRLMDCAIAWAQDTGLAAIRLETQANNVAACRFYEAYGFVLGGYDAFLYSGLDDRVSNDVALFWYFRWA